MIGRPLSQRQQVRYLVSRYRLVAARPQLELPSIGDVLFAASIGAAIGWIAVVAHFMM